MYTEFFGLNEKPFAITPDPRYLYMSARHTDALAHLVYGISESGGFIQLTGEVGTGKTTLIRSLLEQMPEKADIALILSPQLTTLEFLQTIAEELGCPLPQERTVKSVIDALERAPAEGAQRGPPRRVDRRRGTDALARATRAGAPAHEPRDGQTEAAADHLDRPAGAARPARSAGHAADRAAHHRSIPPRAARRR